MYEVVGGLEQRDCICLIESGCGEKDYRKLVAEIAHHDERNDEINSLGGSLREVYMIVKINQGIRRKNYVSKRQPLSGK